MNYSVVYSTFTGNTKLLAESVINTIGEDCVYSGEPSEKAKEADIIFAGFWTDQGVCNKEIKDFISSLENKKVVLFGSAGFGDPKYLNEVMENSKKCVGKTCKVVNTFMCQGKMKQSVRERYERALEKNPDDENMKICIKNFDEALSHPNNDDINRLKNMVKEVIGK